MGSCLSGAKPRVLEHTDGGEEEFHNRYLEDRVLGEGEFGQVKMVHDMKAAPGEQPPLACKILRKGIVFKDNVVYTPLKPEVLKGEVDMLRVLEGKHYCLKLFAVFETPKSIHLVTELCAGGEMMEYVSKQNELRTEDVSRISFQLLSAIHHCATHHIIHRDVKPENCMFLTPMPGAELRLIDFGSGTMDTMSKDDEVHSTFAGSAFYISPEMFQKTYTYKTDVWSAGATLYVLVAGYPADELQKAFNIMHKSKNRNLKDLPNFPEDMPDSYYEMLQDLLEYRHKMRKSAGQVLKEDEFVAFHQEQESLSLQDVVADSLQAPSTLNGSRKNRTRSMKLSGSVQRHSAFLDYQRFERSVTTLLATLLSKKDFDKLMQLLLEKRNEASNTLSNAQKLNIIPIAELKEILKQKLKADQCLSNIAKLPNSQNYENFAYHVDLLAQFARDKDVLGDGERRHSFAEKGDSVHGSNVFQRKRLTRANSDGDGMSNSWHLGQTSGGRRRDAL